MYSIHDCTCKFFNRGKSKWTWQNNNVTPGKFLSMRYFHQCLSLTLISFSGFNIAGMNEGLLGLTSCQTSLSLHLLSKNFSPFIDIPINWLRSIYDQLMKWTIIGISKWNRSLSELACRRLENFPLWRFPSSLIVYHRTLEVFDD